MSPESIRGAGRIGGVACSGHAPGQHPAGPAGRPAGPECGAARRVGSMADGHSALTNAESAGRSHPNPLDETTICPVRSQLAAIHQVDQQRRLVRRKSFLIQPGRLTLWHQRQRSANGRKRWRPLATNCKWLGGQGISGIGLRLFTAVRHIPPTLSALAGYVAAAFATFGHGLLILASFSDAMSLEMSLAGTVSRRIRIR